MHSYNIYAVIVICIPHKKQPVKRHLRLGHLKKRKEKEMNRKLTDKG